MFAKSCNQMDIFTQNFHLTLVSEMRRLEQQPTTFSHAFGCVLNAADHVIILFLTILICWKCVLLKFEKTAFHAFFCTIGFLLLAAEGVMIRYSRNALFAHLEPNLKHRLHYSLQLLGGSLGILGTVQKVWKKKQHFHTLHGQFGLAACLFFMANFSLGAAVFWLDQSSYLLKIVHGFLGIMSFVIALVAQYLGYKTGFFRRNFSSIDSYKAFTVAILVLTLAGPLQMIILKFVKL